MICTQDAIKISAVNEDSRAAHKHPLKMQKPAIPFRVTIGALRNGGEDSRLSIAHILQIVKTLPLLRMRLRAERPLS